ncbi:hypothetical protein BGZ97_004636 [Linnemannia gamsii]|uniref:NTF2 domain-containing protein n=1 Tax=Linnemannia gamsii TaxID=64522 RepID=A0A9P6UGS1_9FUNG|nr:hypothetical protein BGZ97_004636 [Linnemannia gamsii]
MDNDSLAQGFAAAYFHDSRINTKELRRRYREDSLLTVEGTQVTGLSNIEEKLASFFDNTQTHNIRTVWQPSENNILVVVTGSMAAGSERGIPVSHTFFLKLETMTVYVRNHVIALIV